MVHLAACLAGWGGLMLEMVFLRRHGLLLGNTASASVLTLALFLLGLGIGGLLLPRLGFARRRPLAFASLLYAAVAVIGLMGDLLLVLAPPQGLLGGVGLCIVVPGLPALLMGGAFPLLFSVLERHAAPWRTGVLCGANLLGSVAAAFFGGNFLIQDLGLSMAAWLGAGGYGIAALVLALRSRWQRCGAELARPPLTPIGSLEWMALLSGAGVLSIEILMLRRLPFFLDGFQPTMAGVLAACLLGLSLGSMVGPAVCRSLFGKRAAAGSIVLALLVSGLGLHESVSPVLGQMQVDGDFGFHLRILAAALVAAGPACFFLGATIPLCLEGFAHPETRAPLAGRLFFFQGLGSLFGALAMGHWLPSLFPSTYFLYAGPAFALGVVILLWKQLGIWSLVGGLGVGALAIFGLSGGLPFRDSAAPTAGSRYDRPGRYRYLDHRTDSVVTASVVYDRRAHGMILFTDEFRAAYIDQDSGYMSVLGHLPFLLRPSLKQVAVVALGTGTTANAVSRWPGPERLDVVEISPAVVSMVDYFGRQGPGTTGPRAAFMVDPRSRVHVTDGRRYVAMAPPASLDLISMEPLLPYAPGTVPLYTREFYALCRSALSDTGMMVQWVPTHSMPKAYFETLLATFARSFPNHSVWLVNHSTLLVGSVGPHLPSADAISSRLAAAPGPAQTDLHEAGISGVEDLAAAFVGTEVLPVCGGLPDLVDDRPMLENIGYWSAATRQAFLPDNLAVLQAIAEQSPRWPATATKDLRSDRLEGLSYLARAQAEPSSTTSSMALRALARARSQAPSSVLLFSELARARRETMVSELYRAVPSPFDRVAFQSRLDLTSLVRQLDRDPSSAFLWAARAFAEPDVLQQQAAMDRAMALDPTFYDQWPQLWLSLESQKPPSAFRGPLEDLSNLPVGVELVRRATGERTADVVAFRSRFRVRVGYAFVEVLAQRALAADEVLAFRQVLDPSLLADASQVVVARKGDGVAELLPLWRMDLPITPALEDLRSGPVAGRLALATAISGRRTPAELNVLADLMLDEDLQVRRSAAVSLQRSLRGSIEYDPSWERRRLQAATAELRQLIGR
jgi:spermidine synthase